MTEKEQIEEMRKEIENGFQKADCRKAYTNEPYPYFETQKTAIAKALYDAGYRKIKEKNETLEKQIKHINTIVERLDDLLWKGIDAYIMGIDGVEGLKDMWERSAVMAFAEKLKEYINNKADFVYKSECGEYAKINITLFEKHIDELLKEYE